MKLRNIGLTAFFVSGVLILIAGVALMSYYEYVEAFDPSGGGGLALLILWAIFALAAIVYIGAVSVWAIASVVGFSTWFLSAIYRNSSPETQKKMRWAILILVVGGTAATAGYAYLYSRPEAVAKREAEYQAEKAEKEAEYLAKKAEIDAEYQAKKPIFDAKLKEERELSKKRSAEREKRINQRYQLQANKSCQKLHKIMLGKYSIKELSKHSVEYFDQGVMVYTNENGWSNEGKWSLKCSMPKRKGVFTLLTENIQKCPNCQTTDISYQVVPNMGGPDLWLSRQDKKQFFNLTRPIN